MTELKFVSLEGDLSLRRLVDLVPATNDDWLWYYALVRTGDGYRCIHLPQLAHYLEEREWTLDTLLTAFDLSPCAVMAADEVEAARRVQEPFVVVEKDGRPLWLRLGNIRRGTFTSGRRGWWRLVGRRMAELGRYPTWPDPLPRGYRCEPVIYARPETTLRDLAAMLQDREREAVVAIEVADDRWVIISSQELLERIADDFPNASGGSMVGALVSGGGSQVETLRRSETLWKLVEESLPDPSSPPLLIVDDRGRPIKVLRRVEHMRSGESKGIELASRKLSWAEIMSRKPTGRAEGRVVNSWFADRRQQPLPHTRALAANRLYQLVVNVGRPSERAHVAGEQPTLPGQLVDYLVGEGRSLTLRVDSQDMVVLDSERELTLPSAGDSDQVSFRVVTPVRTGLCMLRLGVYFESNMVQSFRLWARVAPAEGNMPEGAGDGWWAECEYTLSSDLANLGELSPRRVCIWVGEEDDRRRRVGFGGPPGCNLGAPLDINVRLSEESLTRYRELLMACCVRQVEGRTEYLYREDHTPKDPATFERGIRELAELGQMLYERVLSGRNLQWLEEGDDPPVVQIARLSLDAAFPWAVIYDRPLHYHPSRNQVCYRFLQDDGCRRSCPSTDDKNLICPYGFWGFRYIIEQPLRPPREYRSVIVRLATRNDRPRVAAVYGPGLRLADHHRQMVDRLLASQADVVVHDRTEPLLNEMSSQPTVVYFYCHGGNTRYRQWLVVCNDDPLLPTHLNDDLRQAWTDSAPLVVLNGCHTGKYTPATLLSFVHRFGALGAAGVIGTEIPIHEYLGSFFGEFLLPNLLKGKPVGRIVYDFRQKLLRRRNLLGLVYVPYCYADLRVATRDRGEGEGLRE